MNQTKWIASVVIVVAVVIGYSILKGPNEPVSTESIKIGIILPLSGDVASLGENAHNGATLALNELPSTIKNRLEFIFEDDKFDAKNTVSAFNKLVDIDKVGIVICFTSTPCGAVAPLADQKEVPLIAVASAPVQKNRAYVVRLELSTIQEGRVMAQYLRTKNYQRIGSIVAIQDGIQSAYNSLVADNAVVTKEVKKESIGPAEKNFRSSISKILSARPDVIVVGLLPGSAGIFAKQARELGYKGDFVGFNFIEGDETLQAAGGAINGIVYTQASDPVQNFIDKYQTTYGKSFGPGSAHLYDAVKIIAIAVESGFIDNTDLITYLKSVKDFSGALGIYSSIENGEFDIPVTLKTVKNGKFSNVE
ncbi:MAG: ABC transporter substrate-binding protein [bacterium]